jgi:hypothetical protein
MADFEERITRDSPPAVRLEHVVRYRSARRLVAASELWCDLGCGNGVAAAAALDGSVQRRVLLVDVVEQALREAEREIAADELRTLRLDLAAQEDLELLRDALLTEPPENGCITCFEVLEHLTTFVPLVELLVEAAQSGAYTVLLSVPNDAFESMQNPHHLSMWGEGAFEELRRLLPDRHVLALQLELRGSTLLRTEESAPSERDATFRFPEALVPSHYLAAFGPRADELEQPVGLHVADRDAQRAWERQRDSDLAYYRALANDQAAELAKTTADGEQDGVSPAAP